jgi:hypothetical protein
LLSHRILPQPQALPGLRAAAAGPLRTHQPDGTPTTYLTVLLSFYLNLLLYSCLLCLMSVTALLHLLCHTPLTVLGELHRALQQCLREERCNARLHLRSGGLPAAGLLLPPLLLVSVCMCVYVCIRLLLPPLLLVRLSLLLSLTLFCRILFLPAPTTCSHALLLFCCLFI